MQLVTGKLPDVVDVVAWSEKPGGRKMHNDARELIHVVMEMIDGTLEHYKNDQHHAPAAWLLENWWHTLNASIKISCSTFSTPTESSQES